MESDKKSLKSKHKNEKNHYKDVLNCINHNKLAKIRKIIRNREMEIWKNQLYNLGLYKHEFHDYRKKFPNITFKNYDEYLSFENEFETKFPEIKTKFPDYITQNFGKFTYYITNIEIASFETNIFFDEKSWRVEISGNTNDNVKRGYGYPSNYADLCQIIFSKCIDNKIYSILSLSKLSTEETWVENWTSKSCRAVENFSYGDYEKLFTSEVIEYWKKTFGSIVFGNFKI